MNLEKKEKENKQKKIIDSITNNYVTISAVLLVLQITLIFGAKNYIVSLILFMLSVFVFILGKDFLEDKQKLYGFRVFKLSILVFFNSLILITVLKTQVMLNDKPLFLMGLMFCLGTTIAFFALTSKEKGREALDNIYNTSILDKLGVEIPGKNELKDGDTILCVNTETKKPVIIPYKDRFLHMLVLGPTGSGKTSQIIIPMINQDMQNLNCGITVLEPKADLAEKIHAMAKHYGRKSVYFNPILPDCPYFNPLFGREEDVIENMATTFKMLNPDSPQFFLDMNETLIRNALKILKRMMGNKATLIELSRLLSNSQGLGRKMVTQFSRLSAPTEEIAKENADIASWFLNEYFNEKSKTYEHCSGLRSQVSKITSNKHLRKVLNPPNGENDVDFDKILEEGGVLAITTAQGALRDLGRFLGYFLILNFQSSVFKRPGNEFTRRPHFLYIDEFQVYSNPGFADMLTQGRSYRVASHLATQNRALIGMGSGRDGQDFIELVSTNARNLIMFPGANSKDAKYYSDEFGEITRKEVQRGTSRAKFNPIYGIQKISYPNETIRESEVTEARYSASDIIFRPFGEITYRIITNNTVQAPGIGKISYIPIELNTKLDEIVEEYNKEQIAKTSELILTKENPNEQIREVADIVMKENNKRNIIIDTNKDIVDRDEEYTDDIVLESGGFSAQDDPLAQLEDEAFDDLI